MTVLGRVALGMAKYGNNSTIFLNSELTTEDIVAEILVHETMHIVIRNLEKIHNSESVIRKILNEPVHDSFLAPNKM